MGALGKAIPLHADDFELLNLKVLRLENRLQRERAARLKAEEIAEKGLRDLYEKQRQVALLETIATAANESTSVEETMRFALEAVCRHTDSGLGNVYVRSPGDEQVLEPMGVFYARDPAAFEPLIAVILKKSFALGEGLPGRVVQSGRPTWIADLAEDGNFPRWPVAESCECRAAFAFPVLVGSSVIGVLEFFHRVTMKPDDQFLSVLAQIGTQLGRVVERRRAQEKLMHDATHDPLTGLPNRLLLADRLERAVSTFRRRPDIGFAVIFIDLDRFKLVNDSLGHTAGDVLLIEIATRFATALEDLKLRSSFGGATLARLGGDEFTILLEDVGHAAVPVDVARALEDALRNPLTIDGQQVYSSASFGIASSEANYDCAIDIMRDADLAMYRAKSEGRARIEIFDKSLHAEAKQRLALETDLRSAVRNKEFVLRYQPIVSLGSSVIVGFEALVRWRRSDGRIVSPAEFIPLAEETGLIVFIGNWVIEEATATLAAWQALYPRSVPLTMSVNVSPRQFHQPDFVDVIIRAVTASKVPPSSLRVEITESVTIQNAASAVRILKRLRQFGVRVSIDDFGTGYSSLSYLHQLPFDTLKIDRSFVAGLQSRSDGGQIVQTILDLAKNLKLDVIAEGTESDTHVDLLRQMGCGYAQGYYFSQPVSEDAAQALLECR